ncbi:MAG: SpaA isopeptide-forming pilin-related protein, partial [Clostridium sp.]
MKKRVTSFLLALLMAVTLLGNGPSVYAQTADGPAISAEETTNEMAEDEALLATPSEAEPSEEPEETEEQPEEVVETAETEEQPEEAVETAEKKEETPEEAAPEEPELSETEVPENGMPVATPSELMFRAAPLLTEYHAVEDESTIWFGSAFPNEASDQFYNVIYLEHPNHAAWKTVAYCINATKAYPQPTDNIKYDIGAYLPEWWEVDIASRFDGPRDGEEIAMEGLANALYKGYPVDAVGIQDLLGLTDHEFWYATQLAVHYWTDSYYDGHGTIDTQNLTLASYPRKHLISYAYLQLTQRNTFLPLPEDARMVMGRPSDDATYQNLVALVFTERQLSIQKEDENHDPVEGAEFTVKRIYPSAEYSFVKDPYVRGFANLGTSDYNEYKMTSGEDGAISLIETGQMAETELDGERKAVLISGFYTLEETKTPDGYEGLKEPFIFHVDENGGITFHDKTGAVIHDPETRLGVSVEEFPSEGDDPSYEGSNIGFRFTITNRNVAPKVGALIVTKTVSGAGGDYNKEFTFTVTLDKTDITGQYGDMTFTDGVATFTLKHGQSKTATGLPAGVSYTVTESNNSGYTVNKTNDTGTIQQDVPATAAFENRNDTPPSYEVSFLKANEAGNPLSDATLTVNNQLTAQTYTWNTNTEVHTLTLKPGLYVVSETNAPGGYIKVKDFNFTLGADGVILLGDIAPGDVVKLEGRKITITDKAEPHEEEFSVEFSKVKLGGEELPGAKIEIYKGTDKVDGWESTTDSHTLSLEAGTYRFHEEAAPEGFVAVTDFEFTVKADGSVTLGTIAQGETVVAENGKITVTDNAKKHEVEFSKVKLGGEELPGARIEIYK